VSDENVPRYFLLLEMAFQTKRRIAFIQQSLVDRAVRRMTNDATLAHRLVLINKWAALLCVTFEAGFVSGQESKATGSELLLNVCRCALRRDPFMRFMTIAAAHFALRHWVMVRQLERRANFQMTLETGLGRLFWIDDRASSAAGCDMQTPWA